MKIRVAGAQIGVIGDIDLNVEAISNAIEYAVGEGADILLTPEGSLSGYTPIFDQSQVEHELKGLVKKASEHKLGLALGTIFVEPDDGTAYNQVRFYSKDGAFLGFHSKILRTTGESKDYASLPLRTFNFHGITVGGLICNDMWANPSCTEEPDPHLTRQLAGMGARVIFHAVNGGRSSVPFMETIRNYHESNLLMRAQADKVWIVTVDNCFPFNTPCSAPSGVVKPDGTWATKAHNQGEQMFVYDIDLGE